MRTSTIAFAALLAAASGCTADPGQPDLGTAAGIGSFGSPGAHTDEGFEATLTGPNGVRGSYALGLWLWYRYPDTPIVAVEATMPTSIPTECPWPP